MIYIANYSEQNIGGGWSFISNLKTSIDHHITPMIDEADWYFIPSATMIQRSDLEKAKDLGKKIALRIDNAVRNSRNRNTGMSRMLDFAQAADVVIYQSEWARNYLAPFTKAEGVVIHNSVNEKIFNSAGKTTRANSYLYTRFNKDETKNWEMARYWYQIIQRVNPTAKLEIVGRFSDELRAGNFDFFEGEYYEYLGVITDPNRMAQIYKQNEYLIYSYFNDACSNSLIEALMCGCKVYSEQQMEKTGGAKEIIELWNTYGAEYFSLDRMAKQYLEFLSE